MKTLIATLIGLGLLTGTANAQFVRIIGPSYAISPEICLPGVPHHTYGIKQAPKVAEAPAQQDEAPAEEAPAEAAPSTPTEPAPQAPQVPK